MFLLQHGGDQGTRHKFSALERKSYSFRLQRWAECAQNSVKKMHK